MKKGKQGMVITTLLDNHAPKDSPLAKEHGFSCYLETDDVKILFDTGASGACIHNAQELGVDLGTIDHLVLSHGHYDHGGGVPALLQQYNYPSLDFWAGKGAEDPKFVVEQTRMRYAGLSFDRAKLAQHHIVWHAVSSDTLLIAPGVWIVTNFTRTHLEEQPHNRFVVVRNGTQQTDDFSDEVALVGETSKGLVLLVGCSHPGILNMIDTVQERFADPLYGIIGGIHLFDATSERFKLVLEKLIEKEIPLVGVCHCTGDKALQYLEKHCHGYIVNQGGTKIVIS